MLLWIQQNIKKIKNRSHGTTFQEISKTNFRSICILKPSIKIINNFNKCIQPLYQKIVNNEKEKNALSSIRDSLLPKLMSGKIRINEM